MNDRRAHERMDALGDVTIKREGLSAEVRKGCLENISFGGFGMSLQEKIEPQSGIDFEMDISTAGELFRGKGIIKYSSEKMKYNNKIFVSGVEFSDVDKDVLSYIIKRVQSKISQQKRANAQGTSFVPF